jgi:small ligand-binding sensory domain FIST
LVLGLAPDGFKPGEELGAADFLVRALVGADAESGALAVGEAVRVGQRLRFMVRDR